MRAPSRATELKWAGKSSGGHFPCLVLLPASLGVQVSRLWASVPCRWAGGSEEGAPGQWEGRIPHHGHPRDQNPAAAHPPQRGQHEGDRHRQTRCTGFQEGQRYCWLQGWFLFTTDVMLLLGLVLTGRWGGFVSLCSSCGSSEVGSGSGLASKDRFQLEWVNCIPAESQESSLKKKKPLQGQF